MCFKRMTVFHKFGYVWNSKYHGGYSDFCGICFWLPSLLEGWENVCGSRVCCTHSKKCPANIRLNTCICGGLVREFREWWGMIIGNINHCGRWVQQEWIWQCEQLSLPKIDIFHLFGQCTHNFSQPDLHHFEEQRKSIELAEYRHDDCIVRNIFNYPGFH